MSYSSIKDLQLLFVDLKMEVDDDNAEFDNWEVDEVSFHIKNEFIQDMTELYVKNLYPIRFLGPIDGKF